MNDKCLLNPKFLKIGKQTLIYNKVKKGKFNDKIPVKIIRNSSYGYFLVKVEKNYNKNNIKLKKGEEYIVDIKLLKKIKENN